MKSVVVYFSQTGNTEKVAKAIQGGIKSATGQCDTIKLEEAEVGDLLEYDLIGLGAPTFAISAPGNIPRFIKRMGPLAGKNCFIFTTYASHPGNIFPSMASKLNKQGLRVIGGFGCDGQYYLAHRFVPWFTDGHPDEIDLKQATDFGREMVRNTERLSKGETVMLPEFKWLRGGVYQDVNIAIKGRFKDLTLDKQKCNYPECRLCVDNCPVNAIDLSVDPIVIQGRGCIMCWFCDQICPTGAIDHIEGFWDVFHEWFSGVAHRNNFPAWFKRAETELIDNRGTLFRKLVKEEIDIDDHEKAAYKVYPTRPRVTMPRE